MTQRTSVLAPLMVLACNAELSVPSTAIISCTTDDDCPQERTCVDRRCALPLGNLPPTISVTAGDRTLDRVGLSVLVSDPNANDRVSLTVAMSRDGTTWCTASAFEAAPVDLPATTTGTNHEVVWLGVLDVSASGADCAGLIDTRLRDDGDPATTGEPIFVYVPDLQIEVMATDSTGLSSAVAGAVVEVGNEPPELELLLAAGSYGGNVPVRYRLTDAALDLGYMRAQFRLVGDTGWTAATIAGPTAELPTSGAAWVVVWDTGNDIGQVIAEVELRLLVNDEPIAGAVDFAAPQDATVTVVNNSPPFVERVAAATPSVSRFTGIVTVEYRLVDEQVDLADIRVAYSVDGTSFQPCTEYPGAFSEGRYRLSTAGGEGELHRFQWDPIADLGDTEPSEVDLRIIAADDTAGPGVPGFARVGPRVGLKAGAGPGELVQLDRHTWSDLGARVLLLDLDQDGHLDLITSGWWLDRDFLVRLGQGDGQFGAPTQYAEDPTSTAPGRILPADWNDDGLVDLLYADEDSFAYVNQQLAPGTMAFGGTVMDHGVRGWQATGDFDGDDNLDFAASDSAGIFLYLGDGNGQFVLDPQSYSTAVIVSAAVGDFNGDTFPDVAIANRDSGILLRTQVEILYGTGATTRTNPLLDTPEVTPGTYGYYRCDFSQPIYCGQHLASLDLDGDGDDELLVVSHELSGASVVTVIDGVTRSPTGVGLPVAGLTPAIWLDEVGGALWTSSIDFDSGPAQNVYEWRSNGRGGVEATTRLRFAGCSIGISSEWDRGGIALGDFFGDSRTDLALVQNCSGGFRQLDLYAASGIGGFAPDVFADQAFTVEALEDAESIFVGDLDADGVVDAGWIGKSNIEPPVVMLLAGAGAFAATTGDLVPTAAAGFAPTFLWELAADEWHAWGDVTGDGYVDAVAFANRGADANAFVVPVGVGLTLATEVDALVALEPTAALMDLDGDGYADVIGNDLNALGLRFANTDAAGWTETFDLSTSVPVGFGARVGVAADFDGDGLLDVAVAGNSGSSYAIAFLFSASSEGTYGTPLVRPLASWPRALAAADFDLDGRVDVAVARDPSNVEVFSGLEEGATPTVTLVGPVGNGVRDLQAGDLNGDGRADLVVVSQAGVHLLAGRPDVPVGAVSFQAATDSGLGSQQRAVALDINRDGVLDLVAGSGSTLLVAPGQRTSAADTWSTTLAGSTAGLLVPTVDAFGDATAVVIGRRPYVELRAVPPEHDPWTELRRSGLTELRDPQMRPLTALWMTDGDRVLREDLGAQRWSVVPRLGIDTAGQRAGLDLAASPPRGVVVTLPVLSGLEGIDFSTAEVIVALRSRDWRRASAHPADPLFGNSTGDPVLPRAGVPGTGRFRPVVIEESNWTVILPDDDNDLTTVTGRGFVVDTSGPIPEVHVLTDRLGVLTAMYRMP